MKPLGLGAIGSGEIAINSIFKHLVLGDTADKVYMAAVCDPVPGRAQAMAEQYGIKNWYMTDDELLADPNVDVVSICSPIRFHYEQGLKAIRAGKHVHFNKTMAMTSEEATELIEEAKRMNVKITSSPGMMAACAEFCSIICARATGRTTTAPSRSSRHGITKSRTAARSMTMPSMGLPR